MQGITCTIQELINLRFCTEGFQAHSHKKVSTIQQGTYLSSFRGKGMDFSETRIYQPGDDIRSIHWRATAKTGKPHTKIFQQERERPVFVIVDFNPSMFFGTQVAFKSLIAAKLASLIAWSAQKTCDRVGGVIFNAEKQILLEPKSRTHGIIALLKNIVNFLNEIPQHEQGCDYTLPFNKLKRILKPGSLIYFISDFYLLNKSSSDILKSLVKSHEVINLFIYDKLEAQPPKDNFYLFSNFDHRKLIMLDTHDQHICQEYPLLHQQRLDNLKKMQEYGLKFTSIETDAELTTILKKLQQVV